MLLNYHYYLKLLLWILYTCGTNSEKNNLVNLLHPAKLIFFIIVQSNHVVLIISEMLYTKLYIYFLS